MTRNDVVCTGLGMICPSGNECEQVFDGLFEGKSSLTRLPLEITNGQDLVGGLVDFVNEKYFGQLSIAGIDRVSQMAFGAAFDAKKDSGIEFTPDMKVGCYIGTSMGGANSLESGYKAHFSANPRVSPLTIVSIMANAPAAQIAMRFGITGPSITYSVACASSAIAIAEASEAIRTGRIDYAIVGGCESILTPGIVRAWQAMKTLAATDVENPKASCKPYSLDRSGLVLAEGAVMLILENKKLAEKRKAKIYAEVAGYGLSCDATHLAIPDSKGQIKAMSDCLKDANVIPSQVGYINSHGTATLIGDITEARSIKAVWGESLNRVKVSSTKSMHGHLLGAAGAIEAAVTILSLANSKILPTANCQKLDPEIDIPLVIDKGEIALELKYAMSNSFAFGGSNCALIFKKYEQK